MEKGKILILLFYYIILKINLKFILKHILD